MKNKNAFWNFFASVKLALFNLIILAVASIAGTLIPQKEPAGRYIEIYGASVAKFFEILDFVDMYNSWWFLTMLVLLSLNLIVCSIDRIPNVWRLIVMNNLDTDPARLEKMKQGRAINTKDSVTDSARAMKDIMAKDGWKAEEAQIHNGIMLFAQKGSWTRLGAYIVHVSILIIFAGAIIGSLLGFKGSIMLKEKTTTNVIYEFGTNKVIPLGFDLRVDDFSLSFYPNGAPKEYRSDLTVLDGGNEVLTKSILVNDPLDYKGITFYQSSYQNYEEFLVTIKQDKTNQQQVFRITPGRQYTWGAANVTFGILNISPAQFGKLRYKIWFSDGNGPPSQFWMDDEKTVVIKRPENDYSFTAGQLYATGLQVAKDPGVWYVYTGCTLMILGLYVAFFMSHRRVWAFVSEDAKGSKIVLGGLSNKNKIGFERDFEKLVSKLQFDQDESKQQG